jgi:hypothetical protein
MDEYLYGGHGEGVDFPGDPLILTDDMVQEYGRNISILLAAISPYCLPYDEVLLKTEEGTYVNIPLELIRKRMYPIPVEEIREIIQDAIEKDVLELHPTSDIEKGTLYVRLQ